MKDIKGTRTQSSIAAAFAGESQARNRYTFFAEQARKEGYEEAAALFERMANNESAHAKIWYRFLNGSFDNTASNLEAAARGENEEWRSMYPGFADIAREEGFEEIADMFMRVAAIEQDHEKSFLRARIDLSKRKADTKGEEEQLMVTKMARGYRCMFCGAVFEDQKAVCPVCEGIGCFEETMVESKK